MHGVIAYVGKRGMGKTLHAAGEDICDALCDGCHVWTNIEIYWDGMLHLAAERWGRVPSSSQLHYIPTESLSSETLLREIKRGESEDHPHLVVLDECALFVPVRGWKNNEVTFGAFAAWLSHSRHDFLDVILMTPSFDDIDVTLRRQCAWCCNHYVAWNFPFLGWLKWFGSWGHITVRWYHEVNQAGTMKGTGFGKPKLNMVSHLAYKCYNSWQTVTNALTGRLPREKCPRAAVTAGWSGIGKRFVPAALIAVIYLGISGCTRLEQNQLNAATMKYNQMTSECARVIATIKAQKPQSGPTSAPLAAGSTDLTKTVHDPKSDSPGRYRMFDVIGRWSDSGKWYYSTKDDACVGEGSIYDSHLVLKCTEHFMMLDDKTLCAVHLLPVAGPDPVGGEHRAVVFSGNPRSNKE